MNAEKDQLPTITSEQYPVVVAHRQAYDNLLWQTPVLSLTAQAFLFSISLAQGTSRCSHVISGLLSLITALASIQLMIKHRAYEKRDSDRLRDYEKAKYSISIHGALEGDQPFYVKWSSYKCWLFVLWSFAIAAAFVFGDALVGTSGR